MHAPGTKIKNHQALVTRHNSPQSSDNALEADEKHRCRKMHVEVRVLLVALRRLTCTEERKGRLRHVQFHQVLDSQGLVAELESALERFHTVLLPMARKVDDRGIEQSVGDLVPGRTVGHMRDTTVLDVIGLQDVFDDLHFVPNSV
jgi:hypothetical protein